MSTPIEIIENKFDKLMGNWPQKGMSKEHNGPIIKSLKPQDKEYQKYKDELLQLYTELLQAPYPEFTENEQVKQENKTENKNREELPIELRHPRHKIFRNIQIPSILLKHWWTQEGLECLKNMMEVSNLRYLEINQNNSYANYIKESLKDEITFFSNIIKFIHEAKKNGKRAEDFKTTLEIPKGFVTVGLLDLLIMYVFDRVAYIYPEHFDQEGLFTRNNMRSFSELYRQIDFDPLLYKNPEQRYRLEKKIAYRLQLKNGRVGKEEEQELDQYKIDLSVQVHERNPSEVAKILKIVESIIYFFEISSPETLYKFKTREDLKSFSANPKLFSQFKFSKEFSNNEQIIITNKIIANTLKRYKLSDLLTKIDKEDETEMLEFLETVFLKDLWHEFLISNKKGKRLLNAPDPLLKAKKEQKEALDMIYVRITSSRSQLLSYISDKNIPGILKKFNETKESLLKELDYCDNLMNSYSFDPKKEKKKKPYMENNPKKREQLEDLYLNALEMYQVSLKVLDLFENYFRKKIGLIQKLSLNNNLEELENIYHNKINYYKESIQEIYGKITGLQEEFEILENSIREQKEILDSLIKTKIEKTQKEKQIQLEKEKKQKEALKELEEKTKQEENMKLEEKQRKELKKKKLETYLLQRKTYVSPQNNTRFLRFFENPKHATNKRAEVQTEIKHTHESYERPLLKKETLEKVTQLGLRLNMEPSLDRIKYILENPFNSKQSEMLFIETKALLYLCATTMENLKHSNKHSIFPKEIVFKFRNALYHNMTLFPGLLGDETRVKKDHDAIQEMVSILYKHFVYYQETGSSAPQNIASNTFKLIIDSEIPNTFELDLCKKLLNHYGKELMAIRKLHLKYPGDEVLLSSARSFIEAQAGCIFAHYEDNYSLDSEFDLYKEQFGYCRAQGNKIRHSKINNPIKIKKQDQESLELTEKNLSLDQYEENFPELENKSKEQKELTDPNPTQIEKTLQTGQKISWGTIHTYSNIKFQTRKEFKKDGQNENRRLK